jgi:hypothetical protein
MHLNDKIIHLNDFINFMRNNIPTNNTLAT